MSFSDSERMAMDALASRSRSFAIDPRDYGRLEAKVDALEAELQEMRKDVKALLALADQSRGGLWVGMSFASLIGGVIGWLATQFWSR